MTVSEDATGSTKPSCKLLRYLIWGGQAGHRSLRPLELMLPVWCADAFLGILTETLLRDNLRLIQLAFVPFLI